MKEGEDHERECRDGFITTVSKGAAPEHALRHVVIPATEQSHMLAAGRAASGAAIRVDHLMERANTEYSCHWDEARLDRPIESTWKFELTISDVLCVALMAPAAL